MLDQAFEALKTYDWGVDKNVLNPINSAIIDSHGNADQRKEIENRLVALLKTEVPRDATDYVCRKLMVIGTSDSVPALASLLPNKDNSHMARYALERIPGDEAAKAMRDALPNLDSDLMIGVIGSLGVRQDAASVPVLAKLVSNDNEQIAASAAAALGAIRSSEAATALAEVKPSGAQAKEAVTDASFACAESLLADGKAVEALAIYKGFRGDDQPKHVRLAATRGMLACTGASK